MIFPLLLAISRRLAALVPTALMSLAAIGAMLLFAKKAFLLSAAALAVSVYDTQRARRKSHKPYHESSLYHLNEAEIEWQPHSPHTHSSHGYQQEPSSHYIYKPNSYDVPIAGYGSYYKRRAGNHLYNSVSAANAVNAVNDYTAANSKVSIPTSSHGNHRDGSTSTSYDVVDHYVEVQHQHDSGLSGESSYSPDSSDEQREHFAPYYRAAQPQLSHQAALKTAAAPAYPYNRSSSSSSRVGRAGGET